MSRHALALAASLILVAQINYARLWRRLPIFAYAQILMLTLFVALMWAYYSPIVPDRVYHPLTVVVDVLCIPLECLYAIELLAFCRGPLYFIGFATIVHAIAKVEEFLHGRPNLLHEARFDVNLFLLVAMIPSVYLYTRKEHYGTRRRA